MQRLTTGCSPRVQFMTWLAATFCILGLIDKVYIFINIGVVTPRCINRDATCDNHPDSSQNHVRSTVWILSPHIDSISHPLQILSICGPFQVTKNFQKFKYTALSL